MTKNENWRLGPRRYKREYSQHQRGAGASCKEIVEFKANCEIHPILVAIAQIYQRKNVLARRRNKVEKIRKYKLVRTIFTILGALKLIEMRNFSTPYLNVVNIHSHRDQLIYIHAQIRVPEYFLLNEIDSKHQAKFDGVHAFLFWLFHWFSPLPRVVLDQERWGYDYSYLSKVFKAVNEWMLLTHGHRLRSLVLARARLAYFNQCILNKINEINQERIHNVKQALPIPDSAYLISLLADCCRLRSCKPGVTNQYTCFN